jgi:hypothetical protein
MHTTSVHVRGSTAQLLFTERCSSVLEFCVIQYDAWTDTEPYITVITKLKWPTRSFLAKYVHWILQSNAWHDNDLNPKSSQKWWTSFGGGQPHLEVEGREFISCVAQVRLPALCSWTLCISSPHVMCELWRHSGYIDQLGRKRAF